MTNQLIRLQPSEGYVLQPNHYYSQQWFDNEQKNLFGRTWTFAGLEAQLSEVGDYLLVEVGYQPMLVTRSKDGKLNALHNVCRHRGAKMLTECGRVQGISCPYHAWRYELSGELTHVPQQTTQFPDLKMSDWGLLKGSVALWDGLVFAHADPDAQPLSHWFAGLDKRLERFRPSRLCEINVSVYPIKANWKFFVENHIDWLHLYYLHSSSLRDFAHDTGELTQHGPHWTSFENVRDGQDSNAAERRPGLKEIPGLHADDAFIGAHLIFPNLALLTSPTSFATVNVQPTGPETCEVEIRTLAMPGSVMPEEGFKELDQVMGEDCSAVERLQQSVRSSAFSVGPMAQRWEEPIVKFQQSYCGFMGL